MENRLKLITLFSLTKNNFPSGTTEMKTAWKVLKDGEKDNYLTIITDVGTQKNVTLGMIGFHLAVATTDHPEFVWATFEQKIMHPIVPILNPLLQKAGLLPVTSVPIF